MKKRDFQKEVADIRKDVIEALTKRVTEVIAKDEADDNLLLHEYDISQPVFLFLRDEHEEDLNQTIAGMFINLQEGLSFHINKFVGGYTIGVEDVELEMLMHLLNEVEEIEL